MLFSKPKKALGIDLGNHSVKVLQLSKQGRKIYIEEAGYAEIDNELLGSDPVKAQINALLTALTGIIPKQCCVVSALPGNTTVVRYPKITLKTNETLSQAVQREAAQYVPFDLNEVFLSWDVIAKEPGEEQIQILLVAAKKDAISSRLGIFQACNIQCSVFDIDSIAILNAIERSRLLHLEETVAIFDIGYSSSSIHFVRGMRSVFIRDLTWGTKDILDAIMKERRCDLRQAEKDLILSSKEVKTEHPEAVEIESPEVVETEEVITAEPVSPLGPLDEEFELERSHNEISTEVKSVHDIIASPISRMIGEVRKSFEFFEHQLYEKPVQRIILCGGVSSYPLIGETLVEEFNVDRVDVAELITNEVILSNSKSLDVFKENSAKFAVAFGLAVRGLSEI
ncbi:MAG TPA: type IV pilus assembly protein PilM [Candidatus Hydrogenedens sp.]|nr:type IV pilus assembly protein PilM [Candidatus Hydrogenedens sp.]